MSPFYFKLVRDGLDLARHLDIYRVGVSPIMLIPSLSSYDIAISVAIYFYRDPITRARRVISRRSCGRIGNRVLREI